MGTEEHSQERSTLRLLVDRWWLIAGMAFLGMLAAFLIAQSQDPVFESSSKYVLTVDPEIQDPSDVASALSVLRNRQITATYAEILQSQTLLERAIREIGAPPGEFSVSSVVLPESNVVSLLVIGPDAELVREVNNLIGTAAATDLAATYPIYLSTLLESPRIPTGAVSPVPARDALFGAAIGAFLGLILATVWPATETEIPEPVVIARSSTRQRAKAGGES